jgi:caffeoyl-CoA O-methyltransferase
MSEGFVLILSLLGTGYLYNLPSLKSKVKKTSVDLDKRVENFLKERRSRWDRWNVSKNDGKFLYDMIIKNNYRRVLEIGTSTGRSAIWMGWALSKTGGKLITIEIDEDTCRRAMRNFRVAGLSDYIHAKLGDAHKLVPELKGPFDLVFADADKEWNIKYLQATEPKIRSGGCFAAHNIVSHDYPFSAMRKFLAYLEKRKDLKTTYNRKSSAGISVSCK